MAEEVEKRSKERVSTRLPVNLGETAAITRNVSASGIFFETSASPDVGSLIDFSVELDSPNGKLKLMCHGEIVRKEWTAEGVGVAVRIIESTMELAQGGTTPQATNLRRANSA
jgi:hypothetical protein